MKEDKQQVLFDKGEWWEEEWQDMPEFNQKNCKPWKSINIHFKSHEDMKAFAELVNQVITTDTRFIWYPKMDKYNRFGKRYVDMECLDES